MDIYSKVLKRRIVKTRLTGILSAILAGMCILFYYLKILNPWLCIMALSYSMAVSFTLNSTYLEMNSSKSWSKINIAFATFFFIATLAIIIYAFVAGEIRF